MPYEQDEHGQWWHIGKRQRTKCKNYTCDKCGKNFHRLPSIASQAKDKLTMFCSRKCSNEVTAEKHKLNRKGKNNPAWKGGIVKTSQGYIKIHNPSHPNADHKGYVLQHRLIMENKLGRYLKDLENVHHINGIKNDNHKENLELWTSSHPSGQRVKDLILWARELLSQYDDEFEKV